MLNLNLDITPQRNQIVEAGPAMRNELGDRCRWDCENARLALGPATADQSDAASECCLAWRIDEAAPALRLMFYAQGGYPRVWDLAGAVTAQHAMCTVDAVHAVDATTAPGPAPRQDTFH